MPQKVVLITGTSSGIGLGAAVALAERGAHVFASMRDPKKADALLSAAASVRDRIEIIQLDVTDPPSVTSAVKHVIQEAGRIDVLVNNAGVASIGPLEFTTDEDASWIFETNVFGPLRVARAVLPHMRAARSGRIVNVSSAAAHARVGIRLWGLYAMSKAALHSMTLELAKEVTPLGVEMVLIEGGVAGATNVWPAIAEAASGFQGSNSPYSVAQAICAAQVRFIVANPTDPAPTISMIADACLTEEPTIRFPAAAQAGISAVNQISDEQFSALARGDTSPALYEGTPGFWGMQRATLADLAASPQA